MGSNGSTNSSPRNRERSDSAEGHEQYHDDDEEDVGMGSIHEDEKSHENGGIEDEVEEVRSALGIMKVEQGKSYYRGETHWAAILSEV